MSRGRTLTDQDDYFITVNWEDMSNKQISIALGVHKETVSRRGAKLGLRNKKGMELGDYWIPQVSSQVQYYGPSPDTIL